MALLAALLGTVTVGVLGAPAPVVGAAEPASALDLTMVSGTISLRDSEEPIQLGSPTTITGSGDGTGSITGGTIATPPLSFEYPVTEFNTTAFIDAVFTQVGPGTGTGAVTPELDVSIDLDLAVDMHVDVGGTGGLVADCRATPIRIGLTSVAPFDPETGRVTLADANFTIPAMSTADPCGTTIGPRINELLAGAGHSIELVMQGTVEKPTIGSDLTTTSLEVSPSQSRTGDEVTMEARVQRQTAGPEDPAGLVEFRDGGQVIGTSTLDTDGRATFVTTDLPVGTRQLTARYQGDPVHRFSTSNMVEHMVARAPTVAVNMTSAVVISGYAPTALVTLTNPSDGIDITNARLSLNLARTDDGFFGFDPAHLEVELRNGDAWETVALSADPSRPRSIGGVIGDAGGFALPAGTEQLIRLRITAPDRTGPPGFFCGGFETVCPGPIELTVALDEVEPGTGTVVDPALGRATHPFFLVEDTRRPTTLLFPLGRPAPHTLRAGHSFEIAVLVQGMVGNSPATGTAQILVDGTPVAARSHHAAIDEPATEEVPLAGGVVQADLLLPPDIEPGEHVLTVRYSGDTTYAPSETASRFTVIEPVGHPFACWSSTVFTRHEMGALVTFDAEVPAVAAPGEAIELEVASAQIRLGRPGFVNPLGIVLEDGATTSVDPGPRPIGAPQLRAVSFGLGPDGTGSAASVTRENGSLMFDAYPADAAVVDQVLTLDGPTASAVVDGAPGEIVPVELDEIVLDLVEPNGLPVPFRCVPVAEALTLGETEIAGTSVSVSPERPREGTDQVTIEARTFPADAAGTVTFSSDLDGTLGTDAVSGGVAELVTGELSPGRHVITASFDATDPGVPDSSGTVEVTVTYSPRSSTEAFVVAARTDYLGSADQADVVADAKALDGGLAKVTYLRRLARSDAYLARVVDGLYRDTLGRAGDEAGVAFWIGRLRSGWSVAQVTASFYGSGEYFAKAGGGTVETWIDDLYLKLLGRASDADGRAFWVRETGRIGKGTVAFRFFQTRESARSRVVALYDLFLDRTPSRTDQDFWATRVIAQGDLALAVELTLSGEYGRRAGNRYPQI